MTERPRRRVLKVSRSWPFFETAIEPETTTEHSTAFVLVGTTALASVYLSAPGSWVPQATTGALSLFAGYALGSLMMLRAVFGGDGGDGSDA